MAELNKKLAEWAGFKQHSYRKPVCGHTPRCKYWVDPDGNWVIELPNFTESLDACFEYLVPKFTMRYPLIVFNTNDNNYSCCKIYTYPETERFVGHGTPALALCLAIEKLIKEHDGQPSMPQKA